MFRSKAVALILLLSLINLSFAPIVQAATYQLSNGESLDINPVELPWAPGKWSILEWGWDVPAGSLGGGKIWVSQQFVQRGGYAVDPSTPGRLCYDNNLSKINWAKYPTIDLLSVPGTPLINRFTDVPYYGITSGLGYVIPYTDLMAADPNLGTCNYAKGPVSFEWTWDSVPAGYVNGNAWVSAEFVHKGFSVSPNEYDFDPTLLNADWSMYPLVDLGYNPFPQYGGITSGVGYRIPYADLMAINPNFGLLRTYDPGKNAFERSTQLGGIQGISQIDGRNVYLIDGSGEHLAYADGTGVHEKNTTVTITRSGGGGGGFFGGLFGGGFLGTVMTIASVALAVVGIPAVAATFSAEALATISTVKTAMSTVGIASSVISGDAAGIVLSGVGFTGVVPPEVSQAAGIAKAVATGNVSPMTFLAPAIGAVGSMIGVPTELGTFDYDLTPAPEADDISGETAAGYPISQAEADQNVEVTPLADADMEVIIGTLLDSEDAGQSTDTEMLTSQEETAFDVALKLQNETGRICDPSESDCVTPSLNDSADPNLINVGGLRARGTAYVEQGNGKYPVIITSNGTEVQTSAKAGPWMDQLSKLSPAEFDKFERYYFGHPSNAGYDFVDPVTFTSGGPNSVVVNSFDSSLSKVIPRNVYDAIRIAGDKANGTDKAVQIIHRVTGGKVQFDSPQTLPNDVFNPTINNSNINYTSPETMTPALSSQRADIARVVMEVVYKYPPQFWETVPTIQTYAFTYRPDMPKPDTAGYQAYHSTNGLSNAQSSTVFLNTAIYEGPFSDNAVATVAHEFQHAFDRVLFPDGYSGYCRAVYSDPSCAVYPGEKGASLLGYNQPQRGFITAYGMTGPWEDIADISAKMITDPKGLQQLMKNDPELARKVNYIQRQFWVATRGAVSADFWQNTPDIYQDMLNGTAQPRINMNRTELDGAIDPLSPGFMNASLDLNSNTENAQLFESNLRESLIKTDFKKVPEAETGLQGGIAGNAFGSPSEALAFSGLGLLDSPPVPPEIEARWTQGDFPRPPYLAMPQARYFWNLWGPPGSPASGSNPPSWWAEYGTTFFPPTSLSEFPNYYCNVGSSGCGAVNPNYPNMPYDIPPESDTAGLMSDFGPPPSRAPAARQPTIEEITAALNNVPTDEYGIVVIGPDRANALLMLYGSPNNCTSECPRWWSLGKFAIDPNIGTNPERRIEQYYPGGLIPLPLQEINYLQNPLPSPTEVAMSIPAQLGANTYNYVAGATPDAEGAPAGAISGVSTDVDTGPATTIINNSSPSAGKSTLCSAKFNTPCQSSAINSCGQRGRGTYDCAGNCQALPPPESSCPVSTTCQDPAATNFRGSLPCAFPAIVVTEHLLARPSLMRSGETTEISWAVTNASSCTVTGTNGDGTASSPTGIWNTLSTGGTPKASTAIQGQTTYTLTCMSLPGATPTSFSESKTVNIIPSYQE